MPAALLCSGALLLPIGPAVAVPITTAFVFAESYSGAGTPIVLVDDNASRRRIIVALLEMPADIASACDSRRRIYARQSQHSGAESGANKDAFSDIDGTSTVWLQIRLPTRQRSSRSESASQVIAKSNGTKAAL